MLTPVRRAPANLDKPTEIVRGDATRMPWAWAGLSFGVALQETSNEGFRDIVNGIACNVQNQTTWTRDNRGNTALFWTNGVGGRYVSWPDSPVHDSPTTAITAYVRLKPTTSGMVTDGGAFYMPYDVIPPYSSWGIQGGNPDPNTMYGTLSLGTTTEYSTPMTATLPTTEWCSVFLRWQSGGLLTMDVLGERGNIFSTVTRSGALSGSIGYNAGTGLRVNATASNTNNYAASYSQALLWNRRLTDTELAALVSDPYGWYSPRPETLGVSSPYPLIGGAGEVRYGTTYGGLR
jgi:hypothetical protein